ncbi:hypothetical protein GRAN_0961 [Granulicella sibirica]|uniref:Uncharacterized protein n=2 Tax=Granulicella sibirica TaxID=2479048 RepID=A0A4Q0T7R9_9BACT|nr:hypothetical protein GRAN_0961 [Granulicella sibirica]
MLFVVDKVSAVAEEHAKPFQGIAASSGEHHTAPVVMAEFSKSCPKVTLTQDQQASFYTLQTQPGGSILADSKGTVLYVSPAKTLKNMVKDVCRYMGSHE